MTVLIITAAVIAVIVILLYCPVTAEISYVNKELRLRVKYLIFTVFSIPAKKKKRREKKPKKEKALKKNKDDISADEEKSDSVSDADGKDGKLSPEDEELLNPDGDKKKQKKTVSEIMDMIRDYKRIILLIWKLVNKHIRKICKCVRISGVEIDITAAGEDAYEASMLYGRLHAAVWNIIAFVGLLIPISVKSAEIKINYSTEEPIYNLSAKVRITPAVIVGNVIVAAIKLLLHINEILPKNGKDVNNGHKS
ncbi:MAG: hypothetical protein ACI4J5_02545 [Oscillospiraceae bacterium]